MFDSNVVRSALFVYIILAGIALFLLWRNSAAPDALKNAGILIASILPVLIVVLPYFKQEKIEKHFMFALIYDTKDKTIVTGDMQNQYSRNYMNMFTNISQLPDALEGKDFSEFMESKGLNIIEKGIIDGLLSRFMAHWDIEPLKFQGSDSNLEMWSSNSKLESNVIQLSVLQEIFKHNSLIATKGILVIPKMSVPPKCIIKTNINNKPRMIIFDNPYCTLKIAYMAVYGGVAQHGIWGVLTKDPKDINRYFVIEYKVDAILLINKTKVYSPETQNYRRWFENICDILNKYDWNFVNKQVERDLKRRTISKILDENNKEPQK